jgi:hypothetical protein
MPIIKKPEPPPEIVAREVHLERPLLATLDSYARFIDTTTDHVITSALRLVFKKDHDFRRWLRAQKSTHEPPSEPALQPEPALKTKKA